MTYLTHLTLLCPEGAEARSPGLPLRLPWDRKKRGVLNRKAVASARPRTGRNRFAVGGPDHFLPRVAEAATLGFETQPLGGKGKAWLMQNGAVSKMSLPYFILD